jgi:hypothetical protein
MAKELGGNWTKLAVRRLAKNRYVTLLVLKTTADFYGWSEFFPTVADARFTEAGETGLVLDRSQGGRTRGRYATVRICRGTSKQGHPKELTNQFRLSRNATMKDYAEVAKGVSRDFGWMEDHACRRRSKDEWLSIADALGL